MRTLHLFLTLTLLLAAPIATAQEKPPESRAAKKGERSKESKNTNDNKKPWDKPPGATIAEAEDNLRQGQRESAINIFKMHIAQNPTSVEVVDLQRRIVEARDPDPYFRRTHELHRLLEFISKANRKTLKATSPRQWKRIRKKALKSSYDRIFKEYQRLIFNRPKKASKAEIRALARSLTLFRRAFPRSSESDDFALYAGEALLEVKECPSALNAFDEFLEYEKKGSRAKRARKLLKKARQCAKWQSVRPEDPIKPDIRF